MLARRLPVHLARLALLSTLAAGGCDAPVVDADPLPTALSDLWTVSGEPAEIVRLSPSRLEQDGDARPAATFTTSSAGLRTLTGLAFDRDGTLWLASADDGLLLGFSPEVLSAPGGAQVPIVLVPAPGGGGMPVALAFDGTGRLWVADHAAGTLSRYDHAQLVTGGPQTPKVMLTGVGTPTGLAFDAAGGLWVSDNVAHSVRRWGRAALESSGSPAPEVVLTDALDCPAHPSGLAFDASGTLWVANADCQDVLGFRTDHLAASGSRAPDVVLSLSRTLPTDPVGLAFDGRGDLWVVGASGTLTVISKRDLESSGAPHPKAQVRLADHSLLWSLAFWPVPAGLPIGR